MSLAIRSHRAAPGQHHRRYAQHERENRGHPEWNDDRAPADDPEIFHDPESKSAVAGGEAGEGDICARGGKMLQIPAGFGRMAGLAVGGPGAGVIDESS